MDATMSVKASAKEAAHDEISHYSPSALPIGTKLNEFIVTDIIGEGGFGIVYAAHDSLLQRSVAIKEYMPAAIANRLATTHVNLRSERHKDTFSAGLQSFIDEARLLAQFKHPALVEILRFWESNGTAYMVMPHYKGKTLRNILKDFRVDSTERWLKAMLSPLLDAIELLHARQIFHRDIAPDNIVIQDNGQPVLLDLGSARRVIAGMQSALTIVVKPGYAPIEQYTEDTAIEQGAWTDIYALGAVLYFTIVGRAPSASVSRMMKDTLQPLTANQYPDFSESFLGAINRSLKLQPADRFQSIDEFREALNVATSPSASVMLSALVSPSPVTNNSSTAKTEDDGKTVILSTEEIEALKQKILTATAARTGNDASTPAKDLLQSNPLATPEPTSKSSFSDVQELIDGTDSRGNYSVVIPTDEAPAKKPQKNDAPRSDTSTSQHNANPRTHISSRFKLHALAISGVVLSALGLLVFVFLSTPERTTIAATTADEAFSSQQTETASNAANKLTDNKSAPTTAEVDTQFEDNKFFAYQRTPAKLLDRVLDENVAPFRDTQTIPAAAPINDSFRFSRPIETITVAVAAAPEVVEPQQTLQAQPKAIVKPKKIKLSSPAIETGLLKLTIIPWGEVWVENKKLGVSPPMRELSLPVGIHNIEIRSPGLLTEMRTVEITKEKTTEVQHNFSEKGNSQPQIKDKPTGSKTDYQSSEPKKEVRVDSQKSPDSTNNTTEVKAVQEWTLNLKILPWGEVWVDGKMAGVTPPLHELKLNKNKHRIELSHPNYPSKIIDVDVSSSENTTIEYSFR